MNKTDLIVIIFLFIAFFLLGFIMQSFRYDSYLEKRFTANQSYLQSRYYTHLQPSPYFVASSIITENHDLNYIKIDMRDKNFDTFQVSDTGSMRKNVGDNNIIIAIKPKIEDIHVGDMIVFYCNKENPSVLHRIIEIEKIQNKTYYLTKGDNNELNDLIGFGCKPDFNQLKWKIVGVLYAFLNLI